MSYTFDTTSNSYFRGSDLRVTRDQDGRTITISPKENYWGLNVKAGYIMQSRERRVRTAAENLTESLLMVLEEEVKEFFWREAEHLAVSHGFEGKLYQEGRSGGWLCLAETENFESLDPIEPIGEEKEAIARWLNFCFDADDLRETAEASFDDQILEANQNLQVELSRYADWVGAEVRTLDGEYFKVARLEIRYGKPALMPEKPAKLFAVADEALLVRKADGNIPARLTADPIMEQLFKIIEFRGDVTSEELNDWLDADDDHDPNELYVKHVAPAVNEIEDAIKADLEAN